MIFGLPLHIPDAFSPNFDGSNDYFVIRGIENYPFTGLHVFNRWGSEEYSNSDYKNQWSGLNNQGKLLTDDTYYFILNLPSGNSYAGFIVLKR